MRSFLILHGLGGSGPGHWQTWLAGRLAAAGERVRYPDLPDADEPHVGAWAEVLHDELAGLEGERMVVCHSLACLLWAREAARIAADRPAGRVLLVAPPCPRRPLPEAASFYPASLEPAPVAAAARLTRVAGSDDDPYCPAGARRSFAEPLGLPFDLLPGAAHVNTDAGYGPWPAVEAWCYGAKKGVET